MKETDKFISDIEPAGDGLGVRGIKRISRMMLRFLI